MHLMEALLCQKKWRNIKKVVVLASQDDRESSDRYILRTAKSIAPIKSSLVVCLCDTQVEENTKGILRNLKVSVCDCGLRAN